jgi:cbb3-type cytochrome oxidase subunit 3
MPFTVMAMGTGIKGSPLLTTLFLIVVIAVTTWAFFRDQKRRKNRH